MKTSQIIAASTLLAGYAQACTRVRVDQSPDQSNLKLNYSTITVYDDNRPPIGVVDHKSDESRNVETWLPREGTNHVDVGLEYYQGIFAKNIGGTVGCPRISGYPVNPLKQKAEYTYWNEAGIEHHVYCLRDNYNCDDYTCGI